MKSKLTNTVIDQAKPGPKPYEIFDTNLPGFLVRVQPTGRKTYYLAYTANDGRRRRFKLGKWPGLRAPAARVEAEKVRGALASNRDPQAELQKRREEAERARLRTLKAFVDQRYKLQHLDSLKSGDATYRRIETVWKHLHSRSIGEITVQDVERWRSEQLKAGKAKATINRDVTALRGALSKAVEWGLLNHHPLARLKPLKLDAAAKVRFLSKDENKRIRDALACREREMREARERGNAWRRERGYDEFAPHGWFVDHLQPLVLVAINTGLRRGELFSLTWENVDFRHNQITVEGRHAKSQQTRHVPMNSEAVETLKKWRASNSGNGLVFAGPGGKRRGSIKTAWGRLMNRSGIKNLRFHDLRHDFASQLVMRGAPLNTVRELLGHQDMKTTLRYAHLATDHKADAVALLHRESTRNMALRTINR